MKNSTRSIVLAALMATTIAALPMRAAAQGDVPFPKTFAPDDASGLAQSQNELTDKLIVKFRDPDAFQVLDAPATMQAANTAGVDVSDLAPVHTLSTSALNLISSRAGVALTHLRPMSGEAHVLQLPEALPQAEVQAIAQRLAQASEVEYAVPSRRYLPTSRPASRPKASDAPAATPNDASYAQQWHYTAPVSGSYGANLPAAWDVTTGSVSIYVAVLDTGILFDHPDIAGRTVSGPNPGQRGYDFVSNVTAGNDGNGQDADPSDPGDWCTQPSSPSSWHGTHVAGTIGAASNNSVGVSGVNWVSKIVPIRALGKCGGDSADIIDGMRWAVGGIVPGLPANPYPARVLNLSLGANSPGSCDPAEQDAINEAVSRGAVVVVAAGNSNANSNYAPGNCVNVVTVAATDKNGNRASYSNYGANVELASPGGNCPAVGSCAGSGVLSTLNAGTTIPAAMNYEWYDGTSMATPHVVGIVSLMLSANPNLNPYQVSTILQSTATAFPNNGGKCDANTTKTCGAGIVNAGAAVAAAKVATGGALKYAYLPMVLRTASVTPGACGTGTGAGLLPNGDFEKGPFVDWTAASAVSSGDPLIYEKGTPDFPAGATTHSGDWLAWLGGWKGLAETASLKQSIAVPTGASCLVYYQIINSNETNCNADFARVLVNGAIVAGSQTGICSTTSTFPNWQKKTLNLNAYAGQTVNIEFVLQTDASNQSVPSSWLLEDVAFTATP